MTAARQYQTYLKSTGISPTTVRNYLSDFNHFWAWLSLESRKRRPAISLSPVTLSTLLTPKVSKKYHMYLVANQVPPTTIARRLSSLRDWGNFAVKSGWLRENLFLTTDYIQYPRVNQEINTAEILKIYRHILAKEGVAPSTIRNYLSDIRHFTAWLSSQ